MFLDQPRGLRDPSQVAARLQLLATDERTLPLAEWATALAKRRTALSGERVVVPWFDPAESGVESRVLVILEAPGPMTNADNSRPGSGFISVDNDDPTAENTWRARAEAGLNSGVLHWNIVPWYLGTAARKPNAVELADGAAELLELMRVLPNLDTVLLAGEYAKKGWSRHLARSLRRPEVRVIETWHPSQRALIQPGKRAAFVAALREAAEP